MKLLIAEDDAFFRNILEQVLAPEHELSFTHDGDEAWAALQSPNAPRLAILDWVMPGLTGPQICRKVRACERLSSMHLILFTARNSTADITSGLRAGADDYITKPFDADELRARVRIGQNKLLWKDAVESQSILVTYALHREGHASEELTRWPFVSRQSTEEGSYRTEGRVIGSIAAAGTSDSNRELIATYPLQHCLEKLHA